MDIIIFLLNLSGATMLLLFAIKLIQTGIDRSIGASFKRVITGIAQNKFKTVGIGAFFAVTLQSSTASALLVVGFFGTGLVSFPNALAFILGADIGSAFIALILSFDLVLLMPILLLIGGWLYLNYNLTIHRQIGRIFIGVGLILVALHFLNLAIEPLRASSFFQVIATYIATDIVTGFIIGALLSFVMVSSIAAILATAVLVFHDVLPFLAAVPMILGANLGSAYLPVWLSRKQKSSARGILFGNFLLRGGWSIIALILFKLIDFQESLWASNSVQALLYVHVGFNIVLALISLPVLKFLERPIMLLMAQNQVGKNDSLQDSFQHASALDPNVILEPKLAIACLQRELLRMGGLIEYMIKPILELYKKENKAEIESIQAIDQKVNDELNAIRQYGAALDVDKMSMEQTRQVRQLIDYAINLEHAGDIIAKGLLVLAEQKNSQNIGFSQEGWAELTDMHEQVLTNVVMALDLLVNPDIDNARKVLEAKVQITRFEGKSRSRHLKRLQEGSAVSFASSDLHLETIYAFKNLNSKITSLAYPILSQNGQLLESRLIREEEIHYQS